MRKYETIYILNPNTSVEDTRKIAGIIVDGIGRGGGKLTKIEDWGIKRLSYLIKKFSRGHYILAEYAGDGPIVRELERVLKISEWVLKYQTVKIEDQVALDQLVEFKLDDIKFQAPHEGGPREAASPEESGEAPERVPAAAAEGDGGDDADGDVGDNAEETEEGDA
ncbi:MAG: 30S ribosomal protein S6 [Myxococcales bacterium]|nr:30S ribosomal protein S6 [Myxococcales bacterium]